MREAIEIGLILFGLFAVLVAFMAAVARPLPKPERLAPMSLNDLADLLRRAADAHHEYELTIGHDGQTTIGADPDWPRWYAAHILKSVDLAIRHRRNPVTEEKR